MLERMHLNSVRDTAGRFFVHFDLCHRFDLVPGLLPREAFIVNEHSVEAMYGLLHIHAKELLGRYLTETMATRIALHGS